MVVVLAIGLGGAIGAILRFGVGVVVVNHLDAAFWATLIVNFVGSVLIGLLMTVFEQKVAVGSPLSMGLVVGFLGGFTTYSAFSMETLDMVISGLYIRALMYVVMTIVLCLLGVWGGMLLGRSL